MRHASSTQQLAVYETTFQAHPVLTREREQELVRRVSDGDLDARRTILLSNVRLVVKVCYRFLRDGMPLEDLVQEGLIGLMTAVEKFEVERGHKFSTYATWWIRQAAWKAAWELRHIVHVPIDNSTKLNRVGRAWEALARESGSEPTEWEIAERLDMDPEAVAALMAIQMDARSVDAPMTASSTDPSDLDVKNSMPDERHEHPLEAMTREQEVDRVLRVLSEEHRELVERRYGLRDPREESLTYRDVGKFFNMTHQRLHRMETEAFQAVRELFSEERHGTTRVLRRVHEERDSEKVKPSALEEAQMALFY